MGRRTTLQRLGEPRLHFYRWWYGRGHQSLTIQQIAEQAADAKAMHDEAMRAAPEPGVALHDCGASVKQPR